MFWDVGKGFRILIKKRDNWPRDMPNEHRRLADTQIRKVAAGHCVSTLNCQKTPRPVSAKKGDDLPKLPLAQLVSPFFFLPLSFSVPAAGLPPLKEKRRRGRRQQGELRADAS